MLKSTPFGGNIEKQKAGAKVTSQATKHPPAELVKKARQHTGHTQTEMAQALGYSLRKIQNAEAQGSDHMPLRVVDLEWYLLQNGMIEPGMGWQDWDCNF